MTDDYTILDEYVENGITFHCYARSWNTTTIHSGMMDPGYFLFPGDILGQTLYQVSKYPNRDWDWEKISREPTLSQCDIEFLPDKPWDWYYIARNQLADKYLLPWKQQIDSCGVAIDGSPWLPGVGFCSWASFT